MRHTLHDFGVHSATIQPEFSDGMNEKRIDGVDHMLSPSTISATSTKDNATLQGGMKEDLEGYRVSST
jgi:hypothetical protein